MKSKVTFDPITFFPILLIRNECVSSVEVICLALWGVMSLFLMILQLVKDGFRQLKTVSDI